MTNKGSKRRSTLCKRAKILTVKRSNKEVERKYLVEETHVFYHYSSRERKRRTEEEEEVRTERKGSALELDSLRKKPQMAFKALKPTQPNPDEQHENNKNKVGSLQLFTVPYAYCLFLLSLKILHFFY